MILLWLLCLLLSFQCRYGNYAAPRPLQGCKVQGSDVHRVVCNNSRKRKLPIHEDGWELSDFFTRKNKKQKNVGSHLLRDEIRKKQMGIEMVPESAS